MPDSVVGSSRRVRQTSLLAKMIYFNSCLAVVVLFVLALFHFTYPEHKREKQAIDSYYQNRKPSVILPHDKGPILMKDTQNRRRHHHHQQQGPNGFHEAGGFFVIKEAEVVDNKGAKVSGAKSKFSDPVHATLARSPDSAISSANKQHGHKQQRTKKTTADGDFVDDVGREFSPLTNTVELTVDRNKKSFVKISPDFSSVKLYESDSGEPVDDDGDEDDEDADGYGSNCGAKCRGSRKDGLFKIVLADEAEVLSGEPGGSADPPGAGEKSESDFGRAGGCCGRSPELHRLKRAAGRRDEGRGERVSVDLEETIAGARPAQPPTRLEPNESRPEAHKSPVLAGAPDAQNYDDGGEIFGPNADDAYDEFGETIRGNSSDSAGAASKKSHAWDNSDSSSYGDSKTARNQSLNVTTPLADNSATKCPSMEDVEARLPSLAFRVILLALYGVVYTLGFIANAITLCVIFRPRDRPMQVINLFIANLAISDMFFCLFSVVITPIYLLYYGYWVFNLTSCKLFASIMSISAYVSTISLINIACLRYCAIKYPHRPIPILVASMMNLGAWAFAIVVTLPYLLHVELIPNNECEVRFCDEQWAGPNDRFLFSVMTLVLQFFLPFLCVAYFYGSVYNILRERDRQYQQRRLHITLPLRSQRELLILVDSNRDNSNSISIINNNNQADEESRQTSSGLVRPQQQRQRAGPNPRTKPTPKRRPFKKPLPGLRRNSLQESVSLGHFGFRTGSDDELVLESSGNRPQSNLEYSLPIIRINGLLVADNAQESSGESSGDDGRKQNGGEQNAIASERITANLTVTTSTSAAAVSAARATSTATAARTINASTATSLNEINAIRNRRLFERNRRLDRTNRKLLYIVILFVFTWLPLNLFNVANDYFTSLYQWPYVKHCFMICHLIASTSVLYNAILYAWMNDNYFQELRSVLPNFMLRLLRFI